MIKAIDVTNRKQAEDVLNVQIPSYEVEADIIGSYEIPPLKETIQTLQHCEEIFIGYYEKEELCGVISIKVDGSEVDIHRLIVHPNHFRKGIAQLLLNYIESTFEVETIKVATGSKNDPAVSFYKKNGFQYRKEVKENEHLSITFFEKSKGVKVMEKELDKALDLRKTGNYKESNELLIKLVQEFPGNASINYQCAWSFDLLGEEANAVPFYENGIKLGLSSKELEGALVGLGSTYRTLGEYEKSKSTFLKGIELFPNNKAIQVFYSMTLYNLNEHSKAMELLLKCLIETTKDAEIISYKKALDFYSDKLDEVWK